MQVILGSTQIIIEGNMNLSFYVIIWQPVGDYWAKTCLCPTSE